MKNIPLHIPLLSILFLLLCTGCGKKLSGTYESSPMMPDLSALGANSAMQSHFKSAQKEINKMNRMTLEFSGSKVKMRTPFEIQEFKYRIKGNQIEILSDALGQKTIIPMTLEKDGSISYNIIRFRKTD